MADTAHQPATTAQPATRSATRRRRQARQARLAILFGLAAFVVGQFVLALVIERHKLILRDPGFGIQAQQLTNRLKAAAADSDLILMFGSSRAAFGFDGQLVEQSLTRATGRPTLAYNFARMGGGPISTWFSMKRLLALGVRPTLVAFEVPAIRMSRTGSAHESAGLRMGWLNEDELAFLQRFDPAAKPAAAAAPNIALPILDYREGLLLQIAPMLLSTGTRSLLPPKGLNASGWAPCAGTRQVPHEKDEAARQVHGGLLQELKGIHYGPELPACLALDELFRLCEREGIATAAVFMPDADIMRSWYPEGTWEELLDYLRGCCQRHHCTLINAREWVSSDDFADVVHLSASGAQEFTLRFNREFLLPYLRSHPPSRLARE